MVDIMKMENDPSVNMNNQESKIAKDVAVQFIANRIGKVTKNQTLRRETEVMIRMVEELEVNKKNSLLNYIKSMKVTDDNGLAVLTRISDQTFKGGISWGRIASLHLFCALLAEHLRREGKESVADKVGQWLGHCVAKHSTWIREEGNGWVRFYDVLNLFRTSNYFCCQGSSMDDLYNKKNNKRFLTQLACNII